MPLWLAPVQVVVLNISEGQADYADAVARTLKRAGMRCEADLRNEKITYKIREHSLQKLPYQLIVGEKEKAAEKVAVRTRSGEDLGQISLPDFIARLRSEAQPGSTA
jgi:threonyl-tRNA synthetase